MFSIVRNRIKSTNLKYTFQKRYINCCTNNFIKKYNIDTIPFVIGATAGMVVFIYGILTENTEDRECREFNERKQAREKAIEKVTEIETSLSNKNE